MNDAVGAIGGLAIIVGLFVAYAMERRERARAAAPKPAALPLVAPPADATTAPPRAEARRTSVNWGMPILYCLLLWAAVTHRHSFWGYFWQVPYFALMAIAAYSTFSAQELAAERQRRPETTRGSQLLMLGVPYVVVPAVGWILAEPFGWNLGALVPALPWIPLVVIALVLGMREQWRGK